MARNKGLLVALLTGVVTGAMWGAPAEAQEPEAVLAAGISATQTQNCGEFTFSATWNLDVEVPANARLVVDDGTTLHTAEAGEEITVGPFTGLTTVRYRWFGGPERDWDAPQWAFADHPAWADTVVALEEAEGRNWGATDVAPFVTWYEEFACGTDPQVEFTDNCEGIAATLSNSEDATTDAEFLVPINPSSKLDKIIVEPAGSVQVFIGAFGESITVTEDVTGQEFTHTWAKPEEGCEKGTEPSPEPSDTAAPPAVGKGGELAQTGAPLPLLGGAGLLLLMLGGGALLLARRRGGVSFT